MTDAVASPDLAAPPTALMPRKRRLRAFVRRHPLIAFTLTILLAALALRLYLGWSWSRQLAATRDALRRAGHAATLADIELDHLPASQNAAVYFTQAGISIRFGATVDCPRSSQLDYPSYPPYGPAWERQAAASEAANAKLFPIARAARQLPRGQLRAGPLNVSSFMYGGYNALRGLANVLADGAEHKHLQGDDAEALQRLRDGYHLGRIMESDPTIVSQLVGQGIDAMMMNATQKIAPTLTIKSASQPDGASADDVRALIAELLDEAEGREALVRCFDSERAFLLDMYDQAPADTWVIRPLADRSAIDSVAIADAAIEAAKARTWPAARQILDAEAASAKSIAAPTLSNATGVPSTVPRYSRWFAVAVGGPAAYDRVIDLYFRWLAERRVTAAILATRLYRVDNGRWPERVADLVPKYLPVIPTDPFLGGDQPIGYVLQRGALPDGGDRPLFFFEASEKAAKTRKAAATMEPFIDTEPMFGWHIDPRNGNRTPRQYRDASLWLPTTRRFDEEQKQAEEERKQSGEESVDENENQSDAPRDDI